MLCFFEEIGGVLPPTGYIYKKNKGCKGYNEKSGNKKETKKIRKITRLNLAIES
jgi:hypothetical protein